MKILQTIIMVSLILLSGFGIAMAGDLDDGISKFTDDGMSSYDDLGKEDKNIKFIIMNSKSQAAVSKKSAGGDDASKSGSGGGGDNNMNSVVMGAGSTIHGDVIIIDDSKGDKIQSN